MSLIYASIAVGDGKPVDVHFNPSSLRVSTTNQFNDDVPNEVSKPTGFKLDVELLFDTTESGKDVHEETRAIRFAAVATGEGAVAHDDAGNDAKNVNSTTPASHLSLVTLNWGTRYYQGYIESLNETLDYWSSDGVPLRATVQLSMKGTTRHFLTGKYSTLSEYKDNPVPALPKVVKASTAKDNTEAFLKAAKSMAGDRSTGRGLAALNGIENMRGGVFAGASASAGFSAGAGINAGASASASAGLAVGGSAQLQAAAGFKMAGGISAGASAGFGIGASAGLSASAGLGASVGVGMAVGAGIGMGGGIGIGGGVGIGAGIGGGIGIGAGMSAGIGGSAGGAGFGVTTSVTGFDGVTTTKSSFTGLDGSRTSSTVTTQGSSGGIFGSASAGMTASGGAFAGLGSSRTTLPSAMFNPDMLLPPPLPPGGPNASYDVSGRVVSNNGQVAATYSASAGVTVW
jgi:hypothetical protein